MRASGAGGGRAVRRRGASIVMRVLVTGHRGYIGSVMVGVLRHARFDVVGLDCDYYEGCDFGRVRETIPSFDMDLRDVEFADLLSFDAVIHLAGLPESGANSVDAPTARAINEEATIRLAACCKRAQVARFLFASTCGVHGRGNGESIDERRTPTPGTAYARSKLRCEQALIALADTTFTPVVLRHASVFGVSPRLRIDGFVNACVASAIATGRAPVPGDGHARQSLVHVEDLARVYAAVLTAPQESVTGEIFHVACPGEVYRTIDVADAVTELLPPCTRRVTRDVIEGPSQRIDASKLTRTFPTFSFRWTLPMGIRQLRNAMERGGMTPGDWRSDRYRRAMRLRTLTERGDLDADLRRVEAAVVQGRVTREWAAAAWVGVDEPIRA